MNTFSIQIHLSPWTPTMLVLSTYKFDYAPTYLSSTLSINSRSTRASAVIFHFIRTTGFVVHLLGAWHHNRSRKRAWPSSWWGWGSTIYCQRPRSQQAPMMPDDEGLWDPPATGHRSQKWFQVTPEAGRGDKERAEECESEQSSNRGRGSKARESRASEKLFTWHW